MVSFDIGLPGQSLLSSLRLHIGLSLLLLPILLASFGARWRAILVLAVVLTSLGQSAAIVLRQQTPRAGFDSMTASASFTALSFNVLASNLTGERAARYIMDSGAQAVVVMEAPGVARYFAEMAEVYPYRLGCEADKDCDLVILSRTPFIESEATTLQPLRRWRLSRVSILVEDHPVTLVGVHLTKPYFDDIAEDELGQIQRFLKAIEGPVLLTGDFNAAAWSDDSADFVRRAELIPPPYYPGTWPVELGVLGVPIDNMFTRGRALIRSISETPEAFGSNHLGLIATVDLF